MKSNEELTKNHERRGLGATGEAAVASHPLLLASGMRGAAADGTGKRPE